MPGSLRGGKKAAQTMLKHNPDHYSDMGKLGGKARNPNKGFGSHPERAVIEGKKGGAMHSKNYSEKVE